MFKTKWDKLNNTVLLSNSIGTDLEIVSPRPVYTDELKMLGFKKWLDLPEENVPVCWAVDKKYYYNGEVIAEVRGGNIYQDPDINPIKANIPKEILPIDIQLLIKQNEKALFSLENEAMDFIKSKHEEYINKVTDFVVAFSGGKDSQVILDLVSRVLPVENYKVIFTDTGMELPCTAETIKATENFYQKKYPNFRLHHAVSDRNVIDMWESYGPPSRFSRWCCSVLKTALFGRKMKDILKTDKQPRVVVFEGVRSDESARREAYNRVGEGVKHINLINCRAIFKWNTTEIFLYMLSRGISINPAYKMGLTRVGCSVCPFASDWSEFVIRKQYPLIAQKYLDVIAKMAQNIGISDKNKIDTYISSGNWKKNAGGKGLTQDSSRVDVISREPNFEIVVMNPKVDWRIWLRTLTSADPIYNRIDDNTYKGEFKYKNQIVKFEVSQLDELIRFKAFGTTNQILLVSQLTKTFTKAAFCENCGVCEVECPTGALKINKGVLLDTTKCINCNNCFNLNNKGCIIATRRVMYEGGKVMGAPATKTSGIDKYSTFGIRDTQEHPWLNVFFTNMDEWFAGYGNLGPKQIPAMLAWLREAELVDLREKKVTELAKLLKPIYNTNPSLVWQIIWINLSFNSAIVKWYTTSLKNDIPYSRISLLESLKEEYPNLNETTLGNPIGALINTFANTPLGGILKDVEEADYNLRLGVLTKVGSGIKEVTKLGTGKISAVAVAYLLYKNAEVNEAYEVTVSDFYENDMHGVYNVFNMPIDNFLNTLRALMNLGVLSVDLLGGLDNIHLSKDTSSMKVLEELARRI